MHSRRILLAFSLAASAASVAFADLVQLDTPNKNTDDRLGQLAKTLSQGSYTHPTDTHNNNFTATVRDQVKVIDNDSLAQKYGSNTSANFGSNTGYSWLVTHPLPDMKRVSSSYGGRNMGGRAEHHSGLDLSAPSGTPIYATGPGVVTKSGWGTGYGQYVEINHGNGYITRYAHASRLVATVGESVKAGDLIANVGCTGRCTGPHLHYEVVKDGQRKNPSTYLALLP
ncbi:murein DD-endopeptidase MepM/ murein hydrolase activator NlpD [Acinetobacter calcoaceticus]|uniref:Murein DD-endopeptidase MepM/ murein hydrolase activator NlpD n=1 Tax=Acinetobacter calcoaceticus TaxID=471 RepID=A0A4R1Y8I4_ACICA|nr:murein DD-endopeptidase MepM/ murein hydrolase activator NlpD [Acinetobacter calcoaceticus]